HRGDLDARERVDLGAILRADGARGARHQDESLAVEAELVVDAVVDAAARAARGGNAIAAPDLGGAAERPTDAHEAVLAAAVVAQRQRRLDRAATRRHHD